MRDLYSCKMTDSDLNNSEFPPVGVWGEEKWTIYEDTFDNSMKKNSLQSSNWGKSLSQEFVDRDSSFKRCRERTLSDSISTLCHLEPKVSKSEDRLPHFSKILKLLLMQMVTTEVIPDENASCDRSEQIEKHFCKILKALIKSIVLVLKTPSEAEILQYCRTVLLEVTVDLDSATVIGLFLQILQASDKYIKRAALSLLSSYCSANEIPLTVIPHILQRLLFLYIEEDKRTLKCLWETVSVIIKKLKYADQLKVLHDIPLAIKFSVCCSQENNLPGLSYPEGIEPILIVYEQAMLRGTIREKKLAAKALQQLIVFSEKRALKPYSCRLTNVLIRNIVQYKQDTCFSQTLGIIIETLAHLIAKIGKKLYVYHHTLTKLLLKIAEDGNKFLYIKSVIALSYLVRFYTKSGWLFSCIFVNIRDCPPLRVKMIYLLHYVVKYACVKIPDKQRSQLIYLVDLFLSSNRASVRTAASVCLATFQGSSPNIKINRLKDEDFFDDTSYKQLRIEKSAELMTSLKEDTSKVLQTKLETKVTEELIFYITANNLEVNLNGLKACGYYIHYKILNQQHVLPELLENFCNAMNHFSEDVNLGFVSVVYYLARKTTLPLYIVKKVVVQLVNGMKKGTNARLHAYCQNTLTAVLNLYKDNKVVEAYMKTLNPEARQSFENVISELKKSLFRHQIESFKFSEEDANSSQEFKFGV